MENYGEKYPLYALAERVLCPLRRIFTPYGGSFQGINGRLELVVQLVGKDVDVVLLSLLGELHHHVGG